MVVAPLAGRNQYKPSGLQDNTWHVQWVYIHLPSLTKGDRIPTKLFFFFLSFTCEKQRWDVKSVAVWFGGQQRQSSFQSETSWKPSDGLPWNLVRDSPERIKPNCFGFFGEGAISCLFSLVGSKFQLHWSRPREKKQKKNRAWHKNNYIYQTQTGQWRVEAGKVFQQNNSFISFSLWMKEGNGTRGNTNKERRTGLSSDHRIGGTIPSSAWPHVDWRSAISNLELLLTVMQRPSWLERRLGCFRFPHSRKLWIRSFS